MSFHAVIETDIAGIILRWNEGAEQLFGHSADVALGRQVDFIIPDHLRDAHWAGFHRAMNEPKINDLAADLPVLCADGEVRHFAGRLLVLSGGLGTAIGALAIYAARAPPACSRSVEDPPRHSVALSGGNAHRWLVGH